MPYPDISPYDLLDITPSATLEQIMEGYRRAIKKKQYPVAQITQAFNDLRNGRKRAEHDLMLYTNLGDSNQIAALMSTLPPVSFIADVAAPVSAPALSGFAVGEPQSDFRPLPAYNVEFQVINDYGAPEAVLLPPTLPD